MKTLRVGTTFSGIGSPEQALKNLNIPHVVKWACDIDKFAKETYMKNHTCEVWYDDITKIDINKLEPVDLYIFGFPCQDVSSIGNQDLSKGRSLLVNYSLDIIDKILPDYIMFENVKGLLHNKFSTFYSQIKERIEKNYNFHSYILNSKNFGVAHNRERVFGIGIRKDLNKNPNNFCFIEKQSHFKDILEQSPESKYFVSEQIAEEMVNVCHREQENFKIEKSFGEVKQANKKTKFGRKKIRYEGTIFCQNLIDIHGFIYPDGKTIRKFTPRECARLQGFPDSFFIHPKDRHTYRQMGNTITVNVLEQIFKNLL